MDSHSSALYDRLAWCYNWGQKYGLYLLGALGGYSFAEFARKIVGLGNVRAGSAVLDAGCGTGYLFPALIERVGSSGSIVGVDFSPGQIAKAAAKTRRLAASNVRPIVGRLEDLEAVFPAATFDAVFCAAVLPVLPDPARALAQMIRVLKPGCPLVLWTISREGLARARFQFYWNWAIGRFDLRYDTQDQISALVVDAGCRTPAIEIIGRSLLVKAIKKA